MSGRFPFLTKHFSICVMVFFIAFGFRSACSSNNGSQTTSHDTQQLAMEPKESPIPIQWTKDNKGKRCEARYYFGSRFKGLQKGEGYSQYCYQLQLKLVRAAREGKLEEIREALKYGANPKLPVDNSFPPLLVAAAAGQTDAVRLLLDNGLQVNEEADFQNTPLSLAASDGYKDTVRLLLERGADPCYRGTGGTAGDIAQARGYKELAEILKAAEATRCK